MLSFIPQAYEFETALTPKQVARQLNKDLVMYHPSVNIMANGRFMREHRFESCYYGCRTGLFDFRVFHHTAKKRDGGSVGFYGRIEPTDNGSRIKGKIRKPVLTYVFAAIWTILTLFIAIMLLAIGEKIGALCTVGIFVVGIIIMFYDNKEAIIKAYLDSLKK